MATEIEGGETDIANGEFLRCCNRISRLASFPESLEIVNCANCEITHWGEEWAAERQHGRSRRVPTMSAFIPPKIIIIFVPPARVRSYPCILSMSRYCAQVRFLPRDEVGGDWICYLEHVQKGRLSGIVETEEQKLGMLVKQAKGRQNVVDYIAIITSTCQ